MSHDTISDSVVQMSLLFERKFKCAENDPVSVEINVVFASFDPYPLPCTPEQEKTSYFDKKNAILSILRGCCRKIFNEGSFHRSIHT